MRLIAEHVEEARRCKTPVMVPVVLVGKKEGRKGCVVRSTISHNKFYVCVMSDLSVRVKIISIVPHFTGALSIIGSSCIIFGIVRRRIRVRRASITTRRRKRTYHRLMLALSCCDLLSSVAFFLSTWVIPQGENEGWKNPYHYAAVGNEQTCTAQVSERVSE